jgi:hypothetical protein
VTGAFRTEPEGQQQAKTDLKDYQARNRVFGSLAGYTSPRPVTWREEGGSQQMFSELVTGDYFSTLGLRLIRGRFFLPEEDSTAGTHAVMNYGTWQSRFGGADDVVGKTLRLNNVVFTVAGVAPPNFIGLNAIFGPDLWIPATMAEQLLRKRSDQRSGSGTGFIGSRAVGVLPAGTLSKPRRSISGLARRMTGL